MNEIRSIRRIVQALTGSMALSAALWAPAYAQDITALCQAGPSGWDKIVAQAKKEGQVMMYSTRAEADNQRLLAGFAKKYPEIRASAIRLIGNRMNERIEQELKAGVPTGDVMVFTDPKWMADRLNQKALLAPCGPALALWDAGGRFYPNRELVPVVNEPWVLAYNTNLVKNKPKDWRDLLNDKQWVGKVGLNEVSGLTVAIWAEIVSSRAGADYFDSIAPFKPRIYPNSAPLTQAIIAGEVVWSPYSLPSTIEPLRAKGAPIEWIVPDSGTFLLQRFGLVLKASTRPAAALVLLDYMMSAEGQELQNGNRQGLTVAPRIKIDSELKVDLNKAQVVDQSGYGPETLRTWVDKFNKLYR
jgi:iron(III) transport system substrate-binding protein